MVDNRYIKTIEPSPDDRDKKRFDTSGRATANLVSELQERSSPKTESLTKNDT